MKNKKSFNIKFTKSAYKKIKKLSLQNKNKNLNFRIYIQGGGCSGFKYGFFFDKNLSNYDIFIKNKNIIIIIDKISIQYIIGSTIDYIENLEGSKFIVNNPNAKNNCSCGLSFDI
ncbi:Iron-sulfur cluster insertion protein ErpA [Candidatus Annandia adelgestsuga]|uniref:Iron-sulfur cluster insertion protein ErpA n=1 Tax=Candidatus Annandia adelgestsuga TaxID=1302411 RepID=A0A3S5HNV5_9ENTR|nr:iron-sulfur cluster insertion protein ErpA [Candidatus Annandia adelgestsuga]AZP36141.1 Iron-sulfur cluster insertion protein ErpA [Candidatus Annandia adelgestsuga]